jgi:hypothetical protein
MLEPTFGGPDAYRAFIELVLPLLVERGRAGPASTPTLRERFTGAPRLADSHRARRLSARAADDGARRV